MRTIFSIILNGWMSVGPALAAGLPGLALVQLVQVLTPAFKKQPATSSDFEVAADHLRTSDGKPRTLGAEFVGVRTIGGDCEDLASPSHGVRRLPLVQIVSRLLRMAQRLEKFLETPLEKLLCKAITSFGLKPCPCSGMA